MSKYNFHNQPLGVETAVTINYDMKELMQGIARELSTISWAVVGKEVQGAVFVSVDPSHHDKLITHGSMVRPEYNGEPLQPDGYLWVVIDQLDDAAAFRARFLTPECIAGLTKEDFSPLPPTTLEKESVEIATLLMDAMVKRSFAVGFLWGVVGSVIVIALIIAICSLIF